MKSNRPIYKFSFLLLITVLLSVKYCVAQYSEYEIKAAYIFNFAKFIDWPANSNHIKDTIVLGVYKNDPFGIVLEKTMLGRKVNGKEWKIVRVSRTSDLIKCNIAFFSNLSKSEIINVLEKLKNYPVLTIGDEIPGFCESGGMINFTPQFSQHQFEINNDEASHHQIVISPKLLLLAKIITTEDEF